MLVYNYHGETKEFLSEATADLDPLESTEENPVYLIPANATEVKPPASVVKKARIFNVEEGTWSYVPDYRGDVVEANDGSKRKHTIVGLGIRPTDVEFEPLADAEQVKLALKDHILSMLDYMLEPTEEKKSTLVTQYQELLNAD